MEGDFAEYKEGWVNANAQKLIDEVRQLERLLTIATAACLNQLDEIATLGHIVTGMDKWLAAQYAVHPIVNARAEIERLRNEAVRRFGVRGEER